MCGICGLVGVDGVLAPALRAALPGMTRMLRHRGPDGQDVFSSDRAALGHARLAIIDRAGGVQPMANEDGSCWVVFNGEIYNHRPLRRELMGRGHRFRTTSDTEVIVHAFEEYGVGCVERLDGMFAFAVYDQRRHELLLARDRLGKKPLFWAILDGALHFASEIKAFYPSPAWNDEIDPSVLEGYLSLGYILAPDTIYRHVHKLEPGHWLHLADGRLDIRKYWDIEEFDTHSGGDAALVAEVDSRLRTAVGDRLESEVPLGAFLSGGIDSGLVVSYMSETTGDRPQTTTVGFSDAAHNELQAAALTARAFETRHDEEVLEPRLGEVLDPIVRAFDEPFADSSAIPAYYLSAMARRHVTVALSGDGGDEAFGGYDFRYVPHAVEDLVRGPVQAMRADRAASWLGRRWPRSPRIPRALRAGASLENVARDAATAYYVDLCFLKPVDTRRLLGLDPTRDLRESAVHQRVTEPYLRCPSSNAVQRAQYADLKVYLPNDVLVKVDRMSMQHGLEVRCPLLDRHVVELAFRIPNHRKWSMRQSKYLLRQLARTRLPARLFASPKRGFTAPVGRWITATHAAEFCDEVLSAGSEVASLVDIACARRWFEEHRAGAADRSYALWALWMLERWSRARKSGRETAVHAEAV